MSDERNTTAVEGRASTPCSASGITDDWVERNGKQYRVFMGDEGMFHAWIKENPSPDGTLRNFVITPRNLEDVVSMRQELGPTAEAQNAYLKPWCPGDSTPRVYLRR